MKRKYHFKIEKFKLSEIKKESPYPNFFNLLEDKEFKKSQIFFNLEAEHFGELEKPVVTKQGYIIHNHRAYQAAVDLGLVEIECIVVNISVEELPRYMNFRNSDIKVGAVTRFHIYTNIRGYLEGSIQEGKLWKEEIKAALRNQNPNKYYDIYDEIGFITGVSGDTIKLYNSIGNNDMKLLEKIDTGEMSVREALAIVREDNKTTVEPIATPTEAHNDSKLQQQDIIPEVETVKADVSEAPSEQIKPVEPLEHENIVDNPVAQSVQGFEAIKDETKVQEAIVSDFDKEILIYDFKMDFDGSNPKIRFRDKLLPLEYRDSEIIDSTITFSFPLKNSDCIIQLVINNYNSLLKDQP